MSDAENNSQNPKKTAALSEDTAVRGPRAFRARKSYYFMRSLLFGSLYFFLVLAVLIMITLIGISIWVKNCHKPITLETATSARSAKLAGWLMFNHLETQPPEVREKLLKKYVVRMKRINREDLNSPVIVKALPYIKQLAQQYSEDRSEKVQDWNQNSGNSHQTVLQNSYKIVKTSDDDYILSSDIVPADILIQEIDKRKTMREAGELPSYADEPRVESNVRILAKEWFMQQMRHYDSQPASQKAAYITESAETLGHFSALYNKALAELGLPVLGEIEQLRNLNYLTSGWIDTSTAEELAKLYWFKDLLISASMAQRANKSAEDSIEPLIRISEKSKRDEGILGGLFSRHSQEEADSAPSAAADRPDDAVQEPENEIQPDEDGFF